MSTKNQIKVPLSYRDIIRAAKRNKIKLTPGKTVVGYPACCVVSTISYDNKERNNEVDFEKNLSKVDHSAYIKLKSIEIGFENNDYFFWENSKDFYRLINENDRPDTRYVAIGKRLRSYAQR